MKDAKKTNVMPRLVADDNGYADHKFAWLDSEGRIMTAKIPSMIQVGGQGLSTTDGRRVGGYLVDDEIEYTCSIGVNEPMQLRTADYPVSVANRVLFTHGLARHGLLGMPVKAAVTLPFRDYFGSDGTINMKLRDQCKKNFETMNVRVMECEAQPQVISVQVYAEALSAWFDWAIQDDGQWSPGYNEMLDTNGEVLIVDIGGSTTDIVSLHMINEPREGDTSINHGKSGTERAGVLDARSKLEELVKEVLEKEGVQGLSGHTGVIPARILERILKTGECNYAGKQWDFRVERDTACRGVAQRISSYIRSVVANPSAYQAILVVGGGAIVFKEWLEPILPNAVFMDEFANAKGLLKFMRAAEQG